MTVVVVLLSALTLAFSAPLMPPRIDVSPVEPLVLFGRQVPVNIARYRTLQDIVWGCIATILACTWAAIHPNLPSPRDSGWTRFKRKVITTIYAIIAPEFMAAWALRQWIAARRIVREFNKEKEEETPWYLVVPYALKGCCICIWRAVDEWFRGSMQDSPRAWTRTHGFFVQMGGFVLYDDDTPLRVLMFDDLKKLIEEGKVDIPKITEDEINEKSKGESIGKLLVVIQTTWFVFQCLARWSRHLRVTELEVVTLAFAAMNIITYGLWWKKPQGVLFPVRIQLKASADETRGDNVGTEHGSGELVRDMAEETGLTIRNVEEAIHSGCCGWLFAIPLRLLQATLRPLYKMLDGTASKVVAQSLRVPMFYADRTDNKEDLPAAVISAFFSCFHLIPWSSSFPSTTERWLWRFSTMVIIAEPLPLYLAIGIQSLWNRPEDTFVKLLVTFLAIPTFLTSPLYAFSRLTLIAVALATLRELPPEAYAAIEWTTFIPHV